MQQESRALHVAGPVNQDCPSGQSRDEWRWSWARSRRTTQATRPTRTCITITTTARPASRSRPRTWSRGLEAIVAASSVQTWARAAGLPVLDAPGAFEGPARGTCIIRTEAANRPQIRKGGASPWKQHRQNRMRGHRDGASLRTAIHRHLSEREQPDSGRGRQLAVSRLAFQLDDVLRSLKELHDAQDERQALRELHSGDSATPSEKAFIDAEFELRNDIIQREGASPVTSRPAGNAWRPYRPRSSRWP